MRLESHMLDCDLSLCKLCMEWYDTNKIEHTDVNWWWRKVEKLTVYIFWTKVYDRDTPAF